MHNLDFSNYFYYDESSPTFLRWNINTFSGRDGKTPEAKIGSVAGCITKNGYGTVRFSGKNYLIHRVISFLKLNLKDDKSFQVDHLDGDRSNNRISNLRIVPSKLNNRNSKLSSKNTSGFAGVCYHKKNDSWTAHWSDLAGKLKTKSFSCSKYGDSESKNKAIAYRARMIEELNKLGTGYSTRHGK